MLAAIVYILCSLTSMACTYFLLRGYRHNHWRLLLWSGLCFLCLAVNNILLFVDRVATGPEVDLSVPRGAFMICGLGILVYGLVWETV